MYIKHSVDEKLLLLLEFSVALFAGWRLDVRAARASELSFIFRLSTVLVWRVSCFRKLLKPAREPVHQKVSELPRRCTRLHEPE